MLSSKRNPGFSVFEPDGEAEFSFTLRGNPGAVFQDELAGAMEEIGVASVAPEQHMLP